MIGLRNVWEKKKKIESDLRKTRQEKYIVHRSMKKLLREKEGDTL